MDAGIGLLGDADGFDQGLDLRIDYFLPGAPQEGKRHSIHRCMLAKAHWQSHPTQAYRRNSRSN